MKELLKKVWQWILDQTDWDEKIETEFKEVVDTYKDTKEKLEELKEGFEERVDRVKEEVSDVVETALEVKKQIDDVRGAIKGDKRKGRPRKKR